MRIIHTSDWHIGHKIYERSRIDEHTKFLDWLLETIIEKKVDVLLVSGDIFDSSMPSGEATDLYYNFLNDLYTLTDASAVIIAGNHDSARHLAAPKAFLKLAGIHVTGSFRESPAECVVSISKNGETASFAAVPYLNEGDILSHVSLEGEVERHHRYREAVRKIYSECISVMPPDSIRILMGHFFIQNTEGAGSERIITIGDTQPVRTSDLPEGAHYIALGHLHRPQQVKGNGCPVIYPGSPIPMSFREAEYGKNVFLIDTDGAGTCSAVPLPVPVFRELVRIEGTLDEILTAASFGNWKDKYVEVRVRLDKPEVGVSDRIRQAFDTMGGNALIVDPVLSGRDDGDSISAVDIKSKSPADIFSDFYNNKFSDSTDTSRFDELLATFNELIELIDAEGGF